MAASVRIEDDAFADERYVTLARVAGLTDADHARGRMLRVWRQCTIQCCYSLTQQTIINILGPDGVVAIVAAELGELDGDNVRIRGAKGRIEWRERMRRNGSKGGRPKKNRRKLQVSETETTDQAPGSALANPPAPAPAPAPAQERERPRRVKAPATPLPADFGPSDSHRDLARSRGVDLGLELQKFRAHAEANDRRQARWPAAFTQWLLSSRPSGPMARTQDPQQQIRIIPSTPRSAS